MIPKRIAVIGGSTVHGEGDPAYGGFVARLRHWHESQLQPGNYVFNLGIPGDTVKDMLDRGRRETTARQAELIIVYPGLNDTARKDAQTAPSRTSHALLPELLSELFTSLQEVAPLVVLSAVPPDEARTCPFRRRFYFLRTDAEVMARCVQEQAEKSGAHFLDIFAQWRDRSDLPSLLLDGLHCNSAGHHELFMYIQEYISRTFGSTSSA